MDSPKYILSATAICTPARLHVSDLGRSGTTKIASPLQASREQQRSITDLKIVAYFLNDVTFNLEESNENFKVQLNEKRQRIADGYSRVYGALLAKLAYCDTLKRELDQKYISKTEYDELLHKIYDAKIENEELQSKANYQEDELQAMQYANTKSRQELQRLREEEAALTNEKMSLDDAILKKRQENEELYHELGAVYQEFEKMRDYIADMQKYNCSLAELEYETYQLQRELQAEKERYDSQNYQIYQLLQQITMYEEENKDLNQQVLELTEEAINVYQDNDALEAKIYDKMLEISRLSNENMKREELIQQNLVQNKERKEQQEIEVQKLKAQIYQQVAKADRLKKEYEKQLRDLKVMCKTSKK